MRTRMRTWMVVGLLGAVGPAPLAAQSPSPVQGTIALEGTMTKFSRGVNAVVVTSQADDTISDAGATKVTVYYADESGQKVAHYFKKTQ